MMHLVADYIDYASFDDLLNAAPHVAIAEVLEVLPAVVTARDAGGNPGFVDTPLRIQLTDVIAGDRRKGGEEVILQLGGTAEGLTLQVDGSRVMQPGTRFLMFATDVPASSERPSGFSLNAENTAVLDANGLLHGGQGASRLLDGKHLDDVIIEVRNARSAAPDTTAAG
jgi:hypothetical protein